MSHNPTVPLPWPPWALATIPRESSEPQSPEGRGRTQEDRIEQLERRLRELEEVYREGFLERTMQVDFLEERLKELEARCQAVDQMLAYGPIPGERVVYATTQNSLTEPASVGDQIRFPVSFPSRPIFLGLAHELDGTDHLSIKLNGWDPVAEVEFEILPVELTTDAASIDPRVRTLGDARIAYFNAAGDFDLETQLGPTASLLPPDSYYEIEVSEISPAATTIEAVTITLILKRVGLIEQMSATPP